jgi:hypothetical protein
MSCKKLDCELKCKATGSLEESVAKDLKKKDKCLSSLLEEEQNDSEDKSIEQRNCGVVRTEE